MAQFRSAATICPTHACHVRYRFNEYHDDQPQPVRRLAVRPGNDHGVDLWLLAAEAVSKAPPDGYTLHVNGANLWIAPLMQKLSYDVVRDFSPISLLVREISVLVVHPSLPVRSVKELIALAKAKPGELNFSSSPAGGSSQASAG